MVVYIRNMMVMSNLFSILNRLLRREISHGSFNPEKENVWFTKSVVGRNKVSNTYRELGEIMDNEDMKRVTGHGGRACHVTYALLNGVTSAAIMQQTGHASVTSMQPYARMSAESEKIMQDVLAGSRRKRDVVHKKNNCADKEEEVKCTSKKLVIKTSQQSPCDFAKTAGHKLSGSKKSCSVKPEKKEVIDIRSSSSSSDGPDHSGSEHSFVSSHASKKGRIAYLESSVKSLKESVRAHEDERDNLMSKLDQVLAAHASSTGINAPLSNNTAPLVQQPHIAPVQSYGHPGNYQGLNTFQMNFGRTNDGFLACPPGGFPSNTFGTPGGNMMPHIPPQMAVNVPPQVQPTIQFPTTHTAQGLSTPHTVGNTQSNVVQEQEKEKHGGGLHFSFCVLM